VALRLLALDDDYLLLTLSSISSPVKIEIKKILDVMVVDSIVGTIAEDSDIGAVVCENETVTGSVAVDDEMSGSATDQESVDGIVTPEDEIFGDLT